MHSDSVPGRPVRKPTSNSHQFVNGYWRGQRRRYSHSLRIASGIGKARMASGLSALHKTFAAPLGDRGRDLQQVAVACGLDELRMRVDQRRAAGSQSPNLTCRRHTISFIVFSSHLLPVDVGSRLRVIPYANYRMALLTAVSALARLTCTSDSGLHAARVQVLGYQRSRLMDLTTFRLS